MNYLNITNTEDSTMSNPQIGSLRTANTLNLVQDCIVKILEKHSSPDNPLCSHEIFGLIDYPALQAIAKSIKPESGGYSVPSSWIGSVAADMANSEKIKQTIKRCAFNHSDDEAWYVEKNEPTKGNLT